MFTKDDYIPKKTTCPHCTHELVININSLYNKCPTCFKKFKLRKTHRVTRIEKLNEELGQCQFCGALIRGWRTHGDGSKTPYNKKGLHVHSEWSAWWNIRYSNMKYYMEDENE